MGGFNICSNVLLLAAQVLVIPMTRFDFNKLNSLICFNSSCFREIDRSLSYKSINYE